MVSADILFPFAADLLFNEPVRCSSRCPEQKSRSRAPTAAPRPILIDVNEMDAEIEIVADLPGVAKGDIQIDIDKNTLKLGVKPSDNMSRCQGVVRPASGNTDLKAGAPGVAEPSKQNGQAARPTAPETAAEPAAAKPAAHSKAEPTVHRKERSLRFLKRALELPETADLSRADATLVDGVLRIVVAKKELPSPKRIRVA